MRKLEKSNISITSGFGVRSYKKTITKTETRMSCQQIPFNPFIAGGNEKSNIVKQICDCRFV